jgi:glycosyltransferase involved in cell wall biosynthesis
VKIALGMTLHNNASFLPEAVGSILSQTCADFHLVMLDDGSTDETPEIATNYAARDPRITFVRQEERQGMIATWRRVFALACEASEKPSPADYFAWASDHDRWDPEWLQKLVACLEHHPNAVLAYPFSQRIDAQGQPSEKPLRTFDTADVTKLSERWRRLCHEGMGAGDMVYGVMRVPAVRSAGVFRDVLRPDRLLIAELALRGQFRQVHEVLWYRRQIGAPSVERQRSTLFGSHRAPRIIGLPPALQHASRLYTNYVWRPDPTLGVARATMIGMIARYTAAYSIRHFRKSALRYRWGLAVEGLYWLKKRAVRAFHVAVYNLLVSTKAVRGRARRSFWRTIYNVLVFAKRIRQRP